MNSQRGRELVNELPIGKPAMSRRVGISGGGGSFVSFPLSLRPCRLLEITSSPSFDL